MPIPEYTKDAIDTWANDRIRPGSFVQAVIDNDLEAAVARADMTNRQFLPDIVIYISSLRVPKFYKGACMDWVNG